MPKPTIVLVHGAWADGPSWNAVSTELQGQGFTVLTPPNLLRGVAGDAAYVASFLAQRTTGPVVLVGHSYGGVVITNAGTGGGDVRALVYVDAFIPEVGETTFQILGGSDGLRRKSWCIACEQFERPPLATRLIAMKPPLVTIDVRSKALDRDSLPEGDTMRREGVGPRHGSERVSHTTSPTSSAEI